MSIRAIAMELYKIQSKVHQLQNKCTETKSSNDKEALKEELREARAELKVLKNMLEGQKEQAGDRPKKNPYTF